jgi:hypothetical protein
MRRSTTYFPIGEDLSVRSGRAAPRNDGDAILSAVRVGACCDDCRIGQSWLKLLLEPLQVNDVSVVDTRAEFHFECNNSTLPTLDNKIHFDHAVSRSTERIRPLSAWRPPAPAGSEFCGLGAGA